MAFSLSNLFGKGEASTGANFRDVFIKEPGDRAEIRMTDTERIVSKYEAGDGSLKLSKTEYPSGRVVETRSYNPSDE